MQIFYVLLLTYSHLGTVVSYHPVAPAHTGDQLDVDLIAALMADIPGLTSKDAKDTDPIMDAYIMAACLARQACLLQLQGPMVTTPMVHFLEEKVADLVRIPRIHLSFKVDN
jgi:hypothetical protein